MSNATIKKLVGASNAFTKPKKHTNKKRPPLRRPAEMKEFVNKEYNTNGRSRKSNGS